MNSVRVSYTDHDSDVNPDCFIRTVWENYDDEGDDDGDGKDDWDIYTYDVVNDMLTKTHYESSDGPGGPEPDDATPLDPHLGPETEAFFTQMVAEFEQNSRPEDGPMGPYPYKRCDLNRDGKCDDSDYEIFQAALGSSVGDINFNSLADFNGDGSVTLEDQNVLFPPVIEVAVDIKPTSCPNPLNVKDKGVLPVAILGTADFDVTTIDPDSIILNLESSTEPGIAPLRWSYEDVATPYLADDGGCHTLGTDGYMDLVLKFDTPSVVALDLSQHADRDTVTLQITGTLMGEFSETPVIGQDQIITINRVR